MRFKFVCLCFGTALSVWPLPAGVRAGAKAPEIEKYAAGELSRYLHDLFGVHGEHQNIAFLIGSPKTNPEVAEALAGREFSASAEGYSIIPLRRHGRRVLVLAGGSPRASLWAVYDLVEQWGVRYLLHGDAMPDAPVFRLPDTAIQREPALTIRQWRLVNELAFGPASWGIADYRPFIDQLAKLRFNRVFISLWSHQPFLRYEYKGIQRHSSAMFFGQRFPISDDLPGRRAFPRNWTEFQNPDIPVTLNEQERLTAGIQHVRAVMRYARQRGMEVVVSANLSDFPKEFAPVFKDSRPVRQVGELTITPGSKVRLDDEDLAGLSRAVLRAVIETYPDANYIALSVPEHRQWIDEYQRAWKQLDAKYGLSQVETIEAVLRACRTRKDFPGGVERAEAEVKGDLVALYFYDRLLHDGRLLNSKNIRPKFIFSSVAEELGPLLAKLLPPGSELLSFIDYTPSRVLRRVESLRAVPASDLSAALIFTLHDDNVGLLPQLATHSLAQLTKELILDKWKGYSTRYWLIGDQDGAAAYLSRASWAPEVTPDQIYRDLFDTVCGTDCVPDVLAALADLESATAKLEWHGLGFAFPVDGMLMKHWSKAPLSTELLSVQDDYDSALSALNRAIRKSSVAGAKYLQYLAGRLQFSIAYFDAVREVKEGGIAQGQGRLKDALPHARRALTNLRRAIDLYAAVSRDQSDRGAIASLNEFAYRPLLGKITELGETH